MQLPFDFILTMLWHLLNISAVAGHGAVPAALFFLNFFRENVADDSHKLSSLISRKNDNKKISVAAILNDALWWS